MRKLLIYMVMIMAMFSCEVVQESDRLVPVDPSTLSGRKHVLLEFTGFRCVNCPTAAKTAEDMQTLFGERLIVVSLHPASNPFTQGKYDYTCPASDSIYLWMGGTETTSFPTGNIDMKVQNDNYFETHTTWPTTITRAMNETEGSEIHCNYEINDKQVNIIVNHSCKEDANVAVWLVEDSVPGVQAMPDGTVNMNYIHRHVLRSVAEDKPFGCPITSDTMEMSVTIPEMCNNEHLHIVALLLDSNDKHILNAYETKLTLTASQP